MITKQAVTAEEFDEVFDKGEEDILYYVNLDEAVVAGPQEVKTRKININMPEWMINALDQEANNLAVNRQAIINMWIAERLESKGLSA